MGTGEGHGQSRAADAVTPWNLPWHFRKIILWGKYQSQESYGFVVHKCINESSHGQPGSDFWNYHETDSWHWETAKNRFRSRGVCIGSQIPDIRGAKGVIVKITGPSDMTLFETHEIYPICCGEIYESCKFAFSYRWAAQNSSSKWTDIRNSGTRR